MNDPIWMLKLRDDEADITIAGSFTADSEIEARLKIKSLIERLFLGSQRIYFDRTPEDPVLQQMAGMMHHISHHLSLDGYYEGGPDSEA